MMDCIMTRESIPTYPGYRREHCSPELPTCNRAPGREGHDYELARRPGVATRAKRRCIIFPLHLIFDL